MGDVVAKPLRVGIVEEGRSEKCGCLGEQSGIVHWVEVREGLKARRGRGSRPKLQWKADGSLVEGKGGYCRYGWFKCQVNCSFRKVPNLFIGKVSISWNRTRVGWLDGGSGQM